MKRPENCILVIFGASGDLTHRKLMPAIFALEVQNLLPENFRILGIGRTEMSDAEFRDKMKQGIKSFSDEKDVDDEHIGEFAGILDYFRLDYNSGDDYSNLKDKLEEIVKDQNGNRNYIFYLAMPPSMFSVISDNLGSVGLNKDDSGYRRIVIEKPFGYDLESGKKLNDELHKVFREDQIYRIDHYLGKETVQNLLVTRFANGIFEPLWNRNYIHHVEITSAESIGVENRGGYYDSSGALRDMVQNHLLQLVGLTAMEPPSSMDANSMRFEILKVMQALRPIKEEEVPDYVIRGQYIASKVRGEEIAGYREEKDVDPESRTETYMAMKFYIDNWRWGGVPFYIRTGKRLPTKVTEIVIHFKPTPHFLFSQDDNCRTGNMLVIRIQPDEGILIKFGMKEPGAGYNVKLVNMDFHYKDLADIRIPEAYERLLYDAMMGDSTLFSMGDVVEAAWKFVTPIQQAWKNNKDIKVYGYPAGTWGPEHADDLVEDKNTTWRYPCKNLADDGEYCEL